MLPYNLRRKNMERNHLEKYDHLVSGLYREFGEYEGRPYVADQKPHAYFRAHLIELGVADTRVKSIAEGFGDLWDALCKLDYGNLQIVCREFEGLATLCKKYGEIEGMSSDFTNSKGEEYK